MKRILIFICIACISAFCVAGDIVRVSAVYEYASNNPNESPAEAEMNAFRQAKIRALEDRFGIDVTAVTQSLMINRVEGEEAKTQTNVFSMGETAVRGEWIETIQEKVLEKNYINGFWVIKVRVEGKARNYSSEKADIQYTFVKDVQDMDSPVTFRDGSDLYLRFSSPVAGYLCVYLVDEEQNAYCLLPYMSRQTGIQSVEANKDYVFFSERYDREAQEYTLNCERSSEQNLLMVVFSPNEFTKAADKQGGKNFRDEQLPRELSYEALMKWLSRNQTKDPDMVVRSTLITIRK